MVSKRFIRHFVHPRVLILENNGRVKTHGGVKTKDHGNFEHFTLKRVTSMCSNQEQ